MKDEDILLREYIRDVISEVEGAYGREYLSSSQMYDAFIGPFVDVFKTAVGKTKELTRRTRTLLTVGVQALVSTLIPFYSATYTDVFDAEEEDIKKIRSKYQDVYDRTDEALKSNDAALLAFMVSPLAFLGANAAKMAPDALAGLLSVTTAGASDEVYEFAKKKLKGAERAVLGSKSGSKPKPKPQENKPGHDPKDVLQGESRIFEDAESPAVDPMKILANKKFLAKVLSAPKVKEMQAAAQEVHRKTLSDVYGQVEALLRRTKTVEDMEKALKGKLKGDVLKKIEEVKKLPPEEKAKAEQMMLAGIKKVTKDFYTKSLTDHVEGVMKAGVPEDSQYVKDYRAVIQKIRSLS